MAIPAPGSPPFPSDDALYALLAPRYEPLADEIAARLSSADRRRPYIVGVTGGQGCGKTTATGVLARLLFDRGFTSALLSLDDLYLPWSERRAFNLRQGDNPYYQIARGLPGTHDVSLGLNVLTTLKCADAASRTPLPRFDKAPHHGAGDRLPMDRWPQVEGRPDVALFEGWMIGYRPLDAATFCALLPGLPVEAQAWLDRHDPGAIRGFEINQRLSEYLPLWDMVELLICLRAPDLGVIEHWRGQQEAALHNKRGEGMDEDAASRFVGPFLLMTALHGQRILGDPVCGTADVVVMMGEDHALERIIFRNAVSRV